MAKDYKRQVPMDPSGFVVLADFVPGIVQEIRYYSTYNFIGDRIDGYYEPYPDTYFEFPVSAAYLKR
ncbi:MAG: hypothetical protein IJT32_02565 [Lachnospiraceae bacterium]|nr:hypothetical protein [Lachnospiraceae bacterium]